jgi:hypothetical protein
MILREFNLDTTEWGKIKLARPSFGSIEHDPWGTLACLKGTPWGDRIPVVSGEVMSHALHGRATPLMRVIGTEPRGCLKLIPDPYRLCAMGKKGCVIYRKEVCHPCPKIPDCYIPPGLDSEQQLAASAVVLAWKENRYVIVVAGAEFSF